MTLRKSHENSEIKQLQEKFYHESLSDLTEKMLRTQYIDRSDELDQ